jgi:hypothetical protein
MTEINWDVTKADAEIIRNIVKRAKPDDVLELTMDITAVHLNGQPLRLADLLKADDFNFWHDIRGIQRHIDRGNGRLGHHFLPRFAEVNHA